MHAAYITRSDQTGVAVDIRICAVTDVGYVASEGSGFFPVSYAYSARGTRFYGVFRPPMRDDEVFGGKQARTT